MPSPFHIVRQVVDYVWFPALFPWFCGFGVWFVFNVSKFGDIRFLFLGLAVSGVILRFLTGLFPCFFGS